MKTFKRILLLSVFALGVHNVKAQAEFITKWETVGNSIVFPSAGTNYTIIWYEEGTPTNTDTINVSYNNIWHPNTINFGSPGTYIVKVTGLNEYNSAAVATNKDELIEVSQWGNASWLTFENAFYQCTNMDVTATDVPKLSGVTTLRGMFKQCSKLKGNESFNQWNTSTITSMRGMFELTLLFNQDLSNWNTSEVTTMAYMFAQTSSFNQNISSWNVSKVTDMTSMFDYSKFNQNLGSWNLSSLTTAEAMFINGAGSGLDCSNYSATLAGWAAAATTPNNVNFKLQNNRVYNSIAAVAHTTLTDTKGWTITGDTYDASCNASVPVEFGDFTAFVNNSNLVVNWHTITEINNKEFVIEVSENGIDGWKKVSVVKTKAENGNSKSRLDYSATLPLAGAGVIAALSLLSIGLIPRRRNRIFAALLVIAIGVTIYSCNKTDLSQETKGKEKVFIRLSQVNKDGTSEILGIKEAVRK